MRSMPSSWTLPISPRHTEQDMLHIGGASFASVQQLCASLTNPNLHVRLPTSVRISCKSNIGGPSTWRDETLKTSLQIVFVCVRDTLQLFFCVDRRFDTPFRAIVSAYAACGNRVSHPLHVATAMPCLTRRFVLYDKANEFPRG